LPGTIQGENPHAVTIFAQEDWVIIHGQEAFICVDISKTLA
jgi:hypothetical protein